MSNRIAIVCEAQGDFDLASRLIDGALRRHVEYIEDDSLLDTYRTYVGPDAVEPFHRWQRLTADRDRDYRKQARGKFGGELPASDAEIRIDRIVFALLARSAADKVSFIVIVKDTDNREDMIEGLRRARERWKDGPVVVGMQHTERECWLIAAFRPDSDDARMRLEEIRSGDGLGIGFDPRPCSERLTATGTNEHKLSPKRVWVHLIGDGEGAFINALGPDCHDQLRANGQGNRLAQFLGDVETRLIRVLFNVHVS